VTKKKVKTLILVLLCINIKLVPPGSAKTTTLFPLNKSEVETSFHVNGFDPPIFSSRTLALKTTSGTFEPSVATILVADLINLALKGLNAIEVESNENKAVLRNIIENLEIK
jgi:hypothetical protein